MAMASSRCCWLFIFSLPLCNGLFAPVIFLPGFGGNSLYANVNDTSFLPNECFDGDNNSKVPLQEDFIVLPVSHLDTSEDQDCLYAILSLNFNSDTNEFLPLPGIKVGPHYFGNGFKGVSPYYWSLEKALVSWGYETNVNIFGAPYDYRIMSQASLVSSGFMSDMQQLVERASEMNDNSGVFLISHSNGGPQSYSFLTAMTQQWRDQYIAGIIGLSGNFLGQMNGYKSVFYADNMNRFNMIASWEATYSTCSWGSYDGFKDIGPLVTTFYGTEQETNYSVSLHDLSLLFESVGYDDIVTKLNAVYPIMNRTAHPKVNIHCLYGQGVDTSYSFIFNETILGEYPIIDTRYMNGDGNQDIIDNTFCDVWNNSPTMASGSSSEYSFEAVGFEGVHHMEMPKNDDVLTKVRSILEAYQN
jgi:hypothetical protein